MEVNAASGKTQAFAGIGSNEECDPVTPPHHVQDREVVDWTTSTGAHVRQHVVWIAEGKNGATLDSPAYSTIPG
jgi:hypothetical protein